MDNSVLPHAQVWRVVLIAAGVFAIASVGFFTAVLLNVRMEQQTDQSHEITVVDERAKAIAALDTAAQQTSADASTSTSTAAPTGASTSAKPSMSPQDLQRMKAIDALNKAAAR